MSTLLNTIIDIHNYLTKVGKILESCKKNAGNHFYEKANVLRRGFYISCRPFYISGIRDEKGRHFSGVVPELLLHFHSHDRERHGSEFVVKFFAKLAEQCGDLSETMKVFHAAKDSADNIVTGIVAQIVRVENMHFTAHLDEGSVAQVQETNRKALEQESGVLTQHRKEQEAIFRKHSEQLADIISRGEGVWMSQRIFYIIAPIALFSICAWVIYFSFWIYFHWIAYSQHFADMVIPNL